MADEGREGAGADAAARHLDLDDYAFIGGIAHALSRHADEILDDLPGLELATEQAFRALSELDKDGRATRRALPFSQLLAETGVAEADLRRVLDRFRADDCSFLVPALSILPVLTPDTRVDVGHEALLRRWEKISPDLSSIDNAAEAVLSGWLRAEQEDGRRYRQMLAFAEFGHVTLPLDQVEPYWEWWNSRPRTAAWAERYGGGFDDVMRLFEQSKAALAAERSRDEATRRARRRRRALSLAALAASVIAIVGVAVYSASQQRELALQQQKLAVAERERAELESTRAELEKMRAIELQRKLDSERGKDITQTPPPSGSPPTPPQPQEPPPAPPPQQPPTPPQPPAPQPPTPAPQPPTPPQQPAPPPAPPQPQEQGQQPPAPQPQEQPPSPGSPPVQEAAFEGACKSDVAPTFRDDFKTKDPGWLLSDDKETYYADGEFIIKAEANTTWAVIYRSLLYINATVCMDVKMPPDVKDASRPSAGIIFWAVDYRNYYVALIYPDGGYLISRKVAGNWMTVSSRKKNDAIKAGVDVINQMKVTTVGDIATLYINGTRIQDLKGQPPSTGGAIGIFGESEKEQQNAWRYIDIAVVELPLNAPVPPMGPPAPTVKAMAEACRPGSKAAFVDDFKVVDTGWSGVPSEFGRVVDGQLRINAAVNSSWRTAYWSLVYKDITLCATVKAPTGMKDPSDTSGGVIFWGVDFDNYYSASVFPDGGYSVDRRVKGQIIKVIPRIAHASVKKGEAAENRVKVVLTGTTGALYINDVKITDFRGQPPEVGGAVGLFGEAETAQRDEWGFTSYAVVEGGK